MESNGTNECLIFDSIFNKQGTGRGENTQQKVKTALGFKGISSNIVDKIFTAEDNRLNRDIYKRRISNPNPLGALKARRISLYSKAGGVNNNSLKQFPNKKVSEQISVAGKINAVRTSGKSNNSLYKVSNKLVSSKHLESDKFVQVSKGKIDDTFLNKENKNIKNFLNNVMKQANIRDTIMPMASIIGKPSRQSMLIYDFDDAVESRSSKPSKTQPFQKQSSMFGSTPPPLIKRTVTVPYKPPARLIDYNFKSRTFKENDILFYKIDNRTVSQDVTVDLENEDFDFPLHKERLDIVDHYLDKFSYKLFRPYRELVTIKNIYDSMSDDELTEETHWYTINPLGVYKGVWDFVAVLLAIYNLTVFPYYLAFNQVESLFVIHLLMNVFFIIDWCLGFFTGYFEDEKVVYDISRIVKHYLTSGSCYINLFISFPYEGFLSTNEPDYISYNHYYGARYDKLLFINKFIEIAKWIELLRFINLKQKLGVLSLALKSYIHMNLYLKTMLSHFFDFAVMIYLATCFWCYLGYNDLTSDTWVTKSGFRDSDNSDIFIAALYYVFYTMFTIGYGDITPYNFKERLYASLLMTLGSVIWSFLLTACSQFFVYNVEKKIILNTKLGILEKYTKEYHLPEGLGDRIRRCIFYDNRTSKKDNFELMNYLPVFLRNELYLSMYKMQVAHLKFFNGQSYNFIISVLPQLQNVQLLQGEFVKNKGEIVKNLDMVIKGVLSINLRFNKDMLEIGEVKSSFHIGDILMYMEDQCPYDIIVKTKVCNMFVLSKTHFAELKMSFKEAISGILISSHADYCVIENRRIQATDYYNEFRTFKGFNFMKTTQYVLTTESSVGSKVRKRMSHISSQIHNEINLDNFILKNRPGVGPRRRSNHKQEIVSNIVNIEDGDGNDGGASGKKSILKKYFSSEDSSDLEPVKCSLATIQEVGRDSFQSSEMVQRSRMSSRLNVKDFIPIQKAERKSFASMVQKNEHFTNKFPINRSLTLNNGGGSKTPVLKSFSKKHSIDISNKMNFMNVINHKIDNDVVLIRNPEIVQEKLLALLTKRNNKIIKKQVAKLKKILYRLNKILVRNLRLRTSRVS
jgi:hypothetical protein